MPIRIINGPEKAFEKYRKNYLNEVIRRKIEFVIDQHQAEILGFRKKWEIRIGGFKNRRMYTSWYKEQLRKFKRGPQIVYQHQVELHLETQKFQVKIPQNISPKKSTIQSIKVGKDFFYYFRQRILELAYRINLDTTYVLLFEQYIYTNQINMRFLPYTSVEAAEKIYYSHQYNEIGKKACLIFGPNTRLKDIQLIWKWQIEPLLKTLPGYISKPPRKKRKL